MLYHKECMATAYLDVTQAVRILSYPGISKTLSINSLELLQTKKEITPTFFCLECGKAFPLEEVVGICGICGVPFPATELYHVSECGGVYCEHDVQEGFNPLSYKITPLKIIMSSPLKIKGGKE
jgi:hypothetical protein